MVLTACGKTEDVEEKDDKKQVKIEEEKKTVEEDVSSEKEILDDKDSQSTADAPVVQEPSNQTESNENQSNKKETTTKPSTGNTDSNKKPSTVNNNTTTKPSTGSTGNTQNNNGGTTTQPSTPVHEHNWVEVTEDEIHYYDWINTCFKCGANLTKMTEDDRAYHVAIVCRSSYGVKLVEVDYVTENIQKEPVVTGYKCECGAEKK